MPGPLALVGGDEFRPGNEPQDRLLVRAAAGDGPAFVVPTAAARQGPGAAVRTATAWFAGLGLDVVELPVLTRADAASGEIARLAATGRFFYLVGGDPGLVNDVLRGSVVWDAIVAAWRRGASLAGSSAGAMALCAWTLVRAGWPNRRTRRYADALGVVPCVAVLPHLGSFGRSWISSALGDPPDGLAALLGIDEGTAAVFASGAWTAMGRGGVTVVDRSGDERRYASGRAIAGLPDPG